MMRQSSSRNQRSKGGFKLRHFLQISLLLVICIWLVYQFKHSHDKKRAFEGRKAVQEQPLPVRFLSKNIPSVKDSRSETRSIDEDEPEDREDEEQDQAKNEDDQYEEGGGGVDDWIDEHDQDRIGKENEQGELTIEEENVNLAKEMDLRAVGSSEENYKEKNVSISISHEIHLTAVKRGNADVRALDVKNAGNPDADMKRNSSTRALAISNFDDISEVSDSTGYMANISSISLGENITLPEAANHTMIWTSTEKNGSDLGVVKELQTNITAASSDAISVSAADTSDSLMATSNGSAELDSLYYGGTHGKETSKLVPFENQKHVIENATSAENHTKLVESPQEFEKQVKKKTSKKQESEEDFTTASFSKNEIDLLQHAVTEAEMEARTDLSTLPAVNDGRKNYNEMVQ